MSRTARALNLYLLLAGIFVLHRILAWPFLMAGFEQAHDNYFQIFFIGILSDHWIAMLVATTAWLVGLTLGRTVFKFVSYVLLLFTCVVVFAHQPYTQFFHFQVIPYHLTYLSDRDFLRANSSSLLTWRSGIIFVAAAASLWFYGRSRLFASYGRRALNSLAGPLLLSAIAGHAMNIHFRVQLFIPENLQMNVFEKLFMELSKSRIVPKLTTTQIHQLTAHYNRGTAMTSDLSETQLLSRLLSHKVSERHPAPVLVNLKNRFDYHLFKGDKPLMLVVLAESLRTSEVGAYGSGSRGSITPNLDRLIASGIAFRSAYSTGTVTRGAQEAVSCGYLGGMSTSLMRNRPDVKVTCLSQLLTNGLLPNGKRAVTFWYHGGEGRFDGQLSFWSNRGMQSLLSFKDFPAKTPQTDWGYSDVSLMATSQQKIAALRSRKDVDLAFGTILTVTNHIPWALPSDSPPGLPSRGTPDAHESWHTTSYTDFAIGELVRGLREAQVWSKTILIITGDHGNLLPPYQRVGNKKPGPEELQTHVPLIVSGGITESTLESGSRFDELSGGHWSEPIVSQADIAPLTAYFLGLTESHFFGELPLAGERIAPVVTDLGQSVYAPGPRILISDKDMLNPRLVAPTSEKDFLTLYYRGFLQFIAEHKE